MLNNLIGLWNEVLHCLFLESMTDKQQAPPAAGEGQPWYQEWRAALERVIAASKHETLRWLGRQSVKLRSRSTMRLWQPTVRLPTGYADHPLPRG